MLKEEFYQIKSLDDIYKWIEKLQTGRLWIEDGISSPHWPIGATRVVQHRVKRPLNCSSFARPEGQMKTPEACYKYHGTGTKKDGVNDLDKCLDSIYSRECNLMYSSNMRVVGKNDSQDDFVKFEPPRVMCLKNAQYAKEYFKLIDSDKDGFLSQQELLADKYQYGKEVDSKMKIPLDSPDKNLDGKIDPSEFEAVIESSKSTSISFKELMIDSFIHLFENAKRSQFVCEGETLAFDVIKKENDKTGVLKYE